MASRRWLEHQGCCVQHSDHHRERCAHRQQKYSYAGSDTHRGRLPVPDSADADWMRRRIFDAAPLIRQRWVRRLCRVGAMKSDFAGHYDAATKTAAGTLHQAIQRRQALRTVYSFWPNEDGQTICGRFYLKASSLNGESEKSLCGDPARAADRQHNSQSNDGRYRCIRRCPEPYASPASNPAEIDLPAGAEQRSPAGDLPPAGRKASLRTSSRRSKWMTRILWAEKPIYVKGAKCLEGKVKGRAAFDTRMSITAKYRITLRTQELVVSERTVVLINVTEAPPPPPPPPPPRLRAAGSSNDHETPESSNAHGHRAGRLHINTEEVIRMQNFKHKVQSQSGASMLMALFLLLVVTRSAW